MQKALVFTPNDEINSVEYKDFRTIGEVVGGTFETCTKIQWNNEENQLTSPLNLTMFCNDEFLVRNDKEFDKVNAVATLLSNTEIRGNVILLADSYTEDGIESRGFEFAEENGEELLCEHMLVFDTFEQIIADNKDKLQEIHKALDNNKSIPKAVYITVDDLKDL